VRYGRRSRAEKLLSQARARKGDKRSAAANDQGNQKTPAMIKAVLIDALSGCEDGTTAPRGGFTDVGLHTGGYERNTSWALIRAVLQALLEEQSLFYRHAMAQLALWLCEASVAALLAENTADAPYRQAIDKCMQMLSVAVQAGSRLADEQIHIRGGDHLKDDMAAFEARSVYVRWQLEQLVLRRASEKALEFELPRLDKNYQPCRNIALSPPPQTVPERPPDGLVAARAKAEANLGWLPDPGVATCNIVDLLSWLRDERLKPSVHGVEAKLVALEAVEHWFYQHAPKLMASDTESYEKDEAQSKQFVATVEQVVDMYRNVASAFQTESKASAALLLTVERKSREVLVMWLAYCFCFKVSLH
jgi:hypothetical protein